MNQHDRAPDKDNTKPTLPCHLCLYVAGNTPAMRRAMANFQNIVDALPFKAEIVEVIDLYDDHSKAEEDQIFAVPTLIRKHPLPLRKIIGDLSDGEKVILGLDLATVE